MAGKRRNYGVPEGYEPTYDEQGERIGMRPVPLWWERVLRAVLILCGIVVCVFLLSWALPPLCEALARILPNGGMRNVIVWLGGAMSSVHGFFVGVISAVRDFFVNTLVMFGVKG